MAELRGRDLRRISETARRTAIAAGELLAGGFRTAMQVRFKSRIDPVTEYDLKSERLIVAAIRKAFPDHAIVTEEGTGTTEHDDAITWIIDPLDGTVNYAHGVPIYCVSIGVQFDGELICGVVFDPERGELFHAMLGGGSYCNRARIQVSGATNLTSALVATGFSYDIKTARRNNLGYFSRVAKQVQGVRRPGSAAIDLCWLAAGRVDAFWELKLHPWDVAAGCLIVSEAGGKLSRVNGRPYTITDADLLATNSHLHRQMLRTLAAR